MNIFAVVAAAKSANFPAGKKAWVTILQIDKRLASVFPYLFSIWAARCQLCILFSFLAPKDIHWQLTKHRSNGLLIGRNHLLFIAHPNHWHIGRFSVISRFLFAFWNVCCGQCKQNIACQSFVLVLMSFWLSQLHFGVVVVVDETWATWFTKDICFFSNCSLRYYRPQQLLHFQLVSGFSSFFH